ncbi:CBS domain-containing protein [Candidatus Poribacteria bacterium]|nr:CBS domain-containing protein [Candidatus Poribacteria bacterium]
MKCNEIMTPNPKMCTPEDNVAVAINLMWDYDCGVVPVVKDLTSNELVGVVTDRDIAMHVVKHACAHPFQVKVGDCMATAVVACQIEDAVEKAIQLMSEHRVRRVPVVDPNNSCVGIISQSDLLSRAADSIEAVVTLLQQISIPHRKLQASVSEANSESKKEEVVETVSTVEPPAVGKNEEEPAAVEKVVVVTTAEKTAVIAEESSAAADETTTVAEQNRGKKNKE